MSKKSSVKSNSSDDSFRRISYTLQLKSEEDVYYKKIQSEEDVENKKIKSEEDVNYKRKISFYDEGPKKQSTSSRTRTHLKPPTPDPEFKDDCEIISPSQMYKLYYHSCGVINNYFGKGVGPYSAREDELNIYVEDLFSKLDSTIKRKLYVQSAGLKSPETDIQVDIIEARNLIVADANGLSDPFAKIWVHKNKVQQTSTIYETLFPIWNEFFTIKSVNMKTDILNIEIWDEDPSTLKETIPQIVNVRNIKGFGNWMKDNMGAMCLGINEDYMGETKINLSEISPEGLENWFKLTFNGVKGNYGEVYIIITPIIYPQLGKHSDGVKRHLQLIQICLEERIEAYEPFYDWEEWEDVLLPPARTLIYQHAIQFNILTVEDLICKFIRLGHLLIDNDIEFDFSLTNEILQGIKNEIPEYEERNLLGSLDNHIVPFFSHCCTQLHSFRRLFPNNDPRLTKQYSLIISCLALIMSFSKENIREKAEKALAQDTLKWLCALFSGSNVSAHVDDKTKTFYIKECIEIILDNEVLGDEILRPSWPTTYSSLTCYLINQALVQEIKPQIEKLARKLKHYKEENKPDMADYLLTLFFSMKALVDFVYDNCSEKIKEKNDVDFFNFPYWFGLETMQYWFYRTQKIITPWVEKSVKMDPMEPVDPQVKFGVSIQDVLEFLHFKLMALWKSTKWPGTESTKVFIECVNILSVAYHKSTHEKLSRAKYYIGNSKSIVMDPRLCVAMNNIMSLITYLMVIEDEIKLVHSDLDIKDKDILLAPMQVIVKRLFNYIDHICNLVSKSMAPTLKTHMHNLAHAKENVDEFKFTLYDYITGNFSMMFNHLDVAAFRFMLRKIWDLFLEKLEHELKFCKSENLDRICPLFRTRFTQKAVYVNKNMLSEVMEYLKSIFNADDDGLEMKILESEKYEQIRKDIALAYFNEKED